MTKSIILYVCGICLFSYLTYVNFWKFHAGWYIDDFANKTTQEMVQLDIVGYYARAKLPYCEILSLQLQLFGWLQLKECFLRWSGKVYLPSGMRLWKISVADDLRMW